VPSKRRQIVALGGGGFYAAFARRAEPSHLVLFTRQDASLRPLVLGCDIVYVGGGSTVNLLAIWRAHGLDSLLREAWTQGVVLAGLSAGAICWFEGGTTDSFGPLSALNDGLGLLRGTFTPHYDGEKGRRPTFHRLVADGSLGDG
jgi:dipeptidase E